MRIVDELRKIVINIQLSFLIQKNIKLTSYQQRIFRDNLFIIIFNVVASTKELNEDNKVNIRKYGCWMKKR